MSIVHRAGYAVHDGERTGMAVHHDGDTVWVRWEDGAETLAPAEKLFSGRIPTVAVAVPLLRRLLADADASPNNATSSYERDAIGNLITAVRAGQS